MRTISLLPTPVGAQAGIAGIGGGQLESAQHSAAMSLRSQRQGKLSVTDVSVSLRMSQPLPGQALHSSPRHVPTFASVAVTYEYQ